MSSGFILPFLKGVLESVKGGISKFSVLARTNFAKQNLRGRADLDTSFNKGGIGL